MTPKWATNAKYEYLLTVTRVKSYLSYKITGVQMMKILDIRVIGDGCHLLFASFLNQLIM